MKFKFKLKVKDEDGVLYDPDMADITYDVLWALAHNVRKGVWKGKIELEDDNTTTK